MRCEKNACVTCFVFVFHVNMQFLCVYGFELGHGLLAVGLHGDLHAGELGTVELMGLQIIEILICNTCQRLNSQFLTQ